MTSLRPGEVASQMQRLPRGVMLWELAGENEAVVVAKIASVAADRESWLQLVATPELSARDRCSLTEMGIAAFIHHPEDLPRLRQMVQGHFARAGRVLH